MSSIPPLPPSNWNPISPPNSIDNKGGGGGTGYVKVQKEQTDEADFLHEEERLEEEIAKLEAKDYLAIIKEFFLSLWMTILRLLGIKKDTKVKETN